MRLNLIVLFVIIPHVQSVTERGLWNLKLKTGIAEILWRTLYKDTVIDLSVKCKNAERSAIQISWLLKETPCYNERANTNEESLQSVLDDPMHQYLSCDRGKYVRMQTNHICDGNITYAHFQGDIVSCRDNSSHARKRREDPSGGAITEEAGNKTNVNTPELTTQSKDDPATSLAPTKPPTVPAKASPAQPKATPASKKAEADKTETSNSKLSTISVPMKPAKGSKKAGLWETGVYLLIFKIVSKPGVELDYTEVEIKMHHKNSYLGPIDYPLYVFYSVMCAVYSIYFVYWLACSCFYRKDMLRVQYWIALVILLGMMEKAFFLKEYTSTNKNGSPEMSGVMMAEIVSALKRALARILVVIVSLGFGIVKPRLGTSFYKVLGLGAAYFLLSCIEAYVRLNSDMKAGEKRDLFVYVPVTIIEAVFFYWTFVSISQTMRTLRLRRNVVKLQLYRHFCNCLIFCLLFALVFMIWSIFVFRFAKCVKHWRELWLNDAFWHMLFALILLAIIILWRPSQNNQRYAFSPLLDESDDEEEEFTKSGALESVKSRSKSPSRSRSASRGRKQSNDDDLKWVDDNIPKSVADAVVALDSDEEIAASRRELSKMD